MKRGVLFGLAGMVLVAVVAMLGPAVAARGAEIGTDPAEKCNPTGRQICLTVKTFSNITASDPTHAKGNRYTYVEWTLRNGGGSTLTNLAVTVNFTDFCGTAQCSSSVPSTAVFESYPSWCSVSGANLACTYPNLAAGAPAATTRVYFKTADLPATSTLINVTATAKERSNDGNPCGAGDPNCDTFSSPITNSYEPELDAAYTFALNGKSFHLETDNKLSSFDFTSASSNVFFSTFKVLAPSTTYCFSDVPCFDRTLFADTQSAPGFSSTNPVVFYARVNPPQGSGVTDKNLTAIHTYDAITFSAAASRLTPPAGAQSFARMDGVSLTASAFGLPVGKYYVVNYSSIDNSFQLSATNGGTALALTDGSGPGFPIRIIGDQPDERSTTGCTTTYASTIPVPSVCAKKVQGTKALDGWLWDAGNGWGQF